MSGEFFYLFVYGTLRAGASATGLLDGCERIGPATVQGTLYDVGGRFPALVLYGNSQVHGEIWRCPIDMLWRLDEYEDVDSGQFRRVAVRADDYACWTYVAGPALSRELTPAHRITSGDWLQHASRT